GHPGRRRLEVPVHRRLDRRPGRGRGPRRADDRLLVKIRIGLGLGTQTLAGDAERFPGFLDALEARGFDSLWLSERLTGPAPDPLVALALGARPPRRTKPRPHQPRV